MDYYNQQQQKNGQQPLPQPNGQQPSLQIPTLGEAHNGKMEIKAVVDEPIKCNYIEVKGKLTNLLTNESSESLKIPISDTSVGNKNAFVCMCIGKPKSGKTFLLKRIIADGFRCGYFKFGIAFSSSNKYNSEYDYFPKKAQLEYSEDTLKKYIAFFDNLKEKYNGKPIPPNCIIIDDSIGKINFSSPIFANLVAIHRHVNCTIFLSIQELKAGGFGSSPLFRNCSSLVFAWKSNQAGTRKGIYESFFGQNFLKFTDFNPVFTQTTDVQHQCLVFNDLERKGLVQSFLCADEPCDVQLTGF